MTQQDPPAGDGGISAALSGAAGGTSVSLDSDAITALLDTGRQLAGPGQLVEPGPMVAPLLLARVRNQDGSEDIQVIDVGDAMTPYLWAPRQRSGVTVLHELDDFVAYVRRLADPESTTVWVDQDLRLFTAVFDDHTDSGLAGWRTDRATYATPYDPEWLAWKSRSGRMFDQRTFARFVEDHMLYIVDPDGQTVFQVALTFQAMSSVRYSSGVRLQNGTTQFMYEEDVTASSGRTDKIAVPNEFTIRVEPLTGCGLMDVTARLRYEINKETKALHLGFELAQVEQVERDAFRALRHMAEQMFDHQEEGEGPGMAALPVFAGKAPTPLR